MSDKNKTPTSIEMTPENEEIIQRALGTLPKFEIKVERKLTISAFGRVFVTAMDLKSAKERAEKIIQEGVADDSGYAVDWNENDERTPQPLEVADAREIPTDDPLAQRFHKI